MEHTNPTYNQIITENLWSLYLTVAKVTSVPSGVAKEFSYTNATPSPWPNFLFHFSKNSHLRLPEIILRMEEKQLPSYIMSDPVSVSQEFQDSLLKSGMKLIMRWPGMILEAKNAQSQTPTSIHLAKVQNECDLKEWFVLAERNLFDCKPFEPVFYQLYSEPNLHFYFAEMEGKKTGTILLHTHNQTTGIYMVSVANEFRNQGIATKMITEIINICNNNNIQFLTLQANTKSENIYRKLGFNSAGYFDIYWKIGLF